MKKKSSHQKGPLIVGTICTLAGLKRLLKVARVPCNVVEVRFDLIGTRDFDATLKLLPKIRVKQKSLAFLGTFRSPREGGKVRLTEAKRLTYIDQFYPYVDLVDVEASSPVILKKMLKRAEIPVVVSFHDFKRTPPLAKLKQTVRSIVRHPETISKIACNVRDPKDLETLRQVLLSSPFGRVAAVGMGRMGPLSRFWLPFQGSVLTYGYLDRSAAPGQVSAEELAEFFKLKK